MNIAIVSHVDMVLAPEMIAERLCSGIRAESEDQKYPLGEAGREAR